MSLSRSATVLLYSRVVSRRRTIGLAASAVGALDMLGGGRFGVPDWVGVPAGGTLALAPPVPPGAAPGLVPIRGSLVPESTLPTQARASKGADQSSRASGTEDGVGRKPGGLATMALAFVAHPHLPFSAASRWGSRATSWLVAFVMAASSRLMFASMVGLLASPQALRPASSPP